MEQKDNPMIQELETLYHVAQRADDTFQSALVKQFGNNRAGDMRYLTRKHNPETSDARQLARDAQENFRQAIQFHARRTA
jgi:hypothetical protein